MEKNSNFLINKIHFSAFNKRIYVFAGELVHEVWRDEQGLQQKFVRSFTRPLFAQFFDFRQAFALTDLFPDGPRQQVTAAFTNQKSGVTLLIEHRTVYRFRWNKRQKRFFVSFSELYSKSSSKRCMTFKMTSRNGIRQLPSKVDFLPKLAFQWKDGHLILSNVRFKHLIFTYFSNLEREICFI